MSEEIKTNEGTLTWAGLTDMERLAVEQAFYKSIAEDVGTKDPTNLRGRVDEALRDMYDATGATSFDVKLCGKKVGSYSFRKVKGTPTREYEVPVVEDIDELWTYQSSEWQAYVKKRTDEWLEENYEQLALDWFDETGELLDGMCMHERWEMGKPDGIGSSSLRVEPEKVWAVLQERRALGDVAAGLLEGGE